MKFLSLVVLLFVLNLISLTLSKPQVELVGDNGILSILKSSIQGVPVAGGLTSGYFFKKKPEPEIPEETNESSDSMIEPGQIESSSTTPSPIADTSSTIGPQQIGRSFIAESVVTQPSSSTEGQKQTVPNLISTGAGNEKFTQQPSLPSEGIPQYVEEGSLKKVKGVRPKSSAEPANASKSKEVRPKSSAEPANASKSEGMSQKSYEEETPVEVVSVSRPVSQSVSKKAAETPESKVSDGTFSKEASEGTEPSVTGGSVTSTQSVPNALKQSVPKNSIGKSASLVSVSKSVPVNSQSLNSSTDSLPQKFLKQTDLNSVTENATIIP